MANGSPSKAAATAKAKAGDDHDSGSKNCDDDEAAAMVIAAMGLVREVDTMAIAMIIVTLRGWLC